LLFTMASASGMVIMLLYLIGEWHHATAKDIDGLTAICQACHNDNVPRLKQLIAAGVDVNDRCQGGTYSPMYYAAVRGNADLVAILVNAGAVIDAKTTEDETALFGAIWSAYWYIERGGGGYMQHFLDTIVELMKFGASIETAKSCKSTDLRYKANERFKAGMQLDSIKAAIAKGLTFQKGDTSVRLSSLEAAFKKLQDRTSVRLVGQDGDINSKAGRLEVYHDGRWGTVCNDAPDGKGDQTDNNMAKVVCRMIGQSGGITKVNHDFGQGSDPTWMDNVGCQGDEKSLFDCKFNPWGEENCSHGEDVGIVCN